MTCWENTEFQLKIPPHTTYQEGLKLNGKTGHRQMPLLGRYGNRIPGQDFKASLIKVLPGTE